MAAGAYGWQPYHLYVPTVLKAGSLNLLKTVGLVLACVGIALPFTSFLMNAGCMVEFMSIKVPLQHKLDGQTDCGNVTTISSCQAIY